MIEKIKSPIWWSCVLMGSGIALLVTSALGKYVGLSDWNQGFLTLSIMDIIVTLTYNEKPRR